MKKKIFLIISIIIIVGVIIFLFYNLNSNKIDISDNATAKVTYVYEGKNVNESLTPKETQTIKNIFNDKELLADNPSCGFDDNISLRFDNNIFAIACDACPIIRYNNKYFYVTDEEIGQIHTIMEKHGAKFPYV